MLAGDAQEEGDADATAEDDGIEDVYVVQLDGDLKQKMQDHQPFCTANYVGSASGMESHCAINLYLRGLEGWPHPVTGERLEPFIVGAIKMVRHRCQNKRCQNKRCSARLVIASRVSSAGRWCTEHCEQYWLGKHLLPAQLWL